MFAQFVSNICICQPRSGSTLNSEFDLQMESTGTVQGRALAKASTLSTRGRKDHNENECNWAGKVVPCCPSLRFVFGCFFFRWVPLCFAKPEYHTTVFFLGFRSATNDSWFVTSFPPLYVPPATHQTAIMPRPTAASLVRRVLKIIIASWYTKVANKTAHA